MCIGKFKLLTAEVKSLKFVQNKSLAENLSVDEENKWVVLLIL